MKDILTPPKAWAHLPFFKGPWETVLTRLQMESRPILPPPDSIFAALELCAPAQTRVLVLGQDPYPTPGHAHGLAFSVAPHVSPLPRSLKNIFKELEDDLDVVPVSGDLRSWALQGVLLLNTALTVPAGGAGGHLTLGWHALIEDILTELDQSPRALLLWGKSAQKVAGRLQNPEHLRLESAHPSPLSARRGFFGSRPFSRVNDWLKQRGSDPIDWSGHGGHHSRQDQSL